ncbi:hypothetical protein FRC08_001875 [Ceratobasidium sp. 394]|nr:hypothetical protein FRC08_001875 [Ceratobasidium sp. 394]
MSEDDSDNDEDGGAHVIDRELQEAFQTLTQSLDWDRLTNVTDPMEIESQDGEDTRMFDDDDFLEDSDIQQQHPGSPILVDEPHRSAPQTGLAEEGSMPHSVAPSVPIASTSRDALGDPRRSWDPTESSSLGDQIRQSTSHQSTAHIHLARQPPLATTGARERPSGSSHPVASTSTGAPHRRSVSTQVLSAGAARRQPAAPDPFSHGVQSMSRGSEPIRGSQPADLAPPSQSAWSRPLRLQPSRQVETWHRPAAREQALPEAGSRDINPTPGSASQSRSHGVRPGSTHMRVASHPVIASGSRDTSGGAALSHQTVTPSHWPPRASTPPPTATQDHPLGVSEPVAGPSYRRVRPPPDSPERRKQPTASQALFNMTRSLAPMERTGSLVQLDADQSLRRRAERGDPYQHIEDAHGVFSFSNLLHIKDEAGRWCYRCLAYGGAYTTHTAENCPEQLGPESYQLSDVTHANQTYSNMRDWLRKSSKIPFNRTLCVFCFWPYSDLHNHPRPPIAQKATAEHCSVQDFVLPFLWIALSNPEICQQLFENFQITQLQLTNPYEFFTWCVEPHRRGPVNFNGTRTTYYNAHGVLAWTAIRVRDCHIPGVR